MQPARRWRLRRLLHLQLRTRCPSHPSVTQDTQGHSEVVLKCWGLHRQAWSPERWEEVGLSL